MFSRIRYSSFFAALLVVLAATAWLVFLPIQFGGAAAYVIINGISMEPTYYTGDLVITRREASYEKGDIVTYFNSDINQYVIHRVVGRESGRFILQGDNNTWLDNERPKIESITGKAWLHFPGLGAWLARLQTPLGLSLLAGLIFFIILSMYAFRDKDARKRIRKFFSGIRFAKIAPRFSPGDSFMRQAGRQLEILVFIFVIIFATSLVLAFVSFGQDEYLSQTVDSELLHLGLFSYSAPAMAGVYDPGSPETGDPIFLKTTCQVTVRYDYRLAGESLNDLRGMISMRAEARDINGWQRSFPLVSQTEFDGSAAFAQSELNPCQILATMRQAEEKTGLYRPAYTLLIVPEVNLQGTRKNGEPVETSFSSPLSFVLDDFQMYVQADGFGQDPLAPFKSEIQAIARQTPNLLELPGFAVTISAARMMSMLGLFTSLALGLFLGYQIYIALKRDPTIGISLRYGSLLVEIEQVSFNVRTREITVFSFDDLVKLAERNATVIMHLRHPYQDEFLVEGSNMVYRFDLPRKKEDPKHEPS
jgi:signal peptidase I